jgi:hypothetical protein
MSCIAGVLRQVILVPAGRERLANRRVRLPLIPKTQRRGAAAMVASSAGSVKRTSSRIKSRSR